MLRAHRQAWCWQDEYYGLTMEDIRRLEHETQLALKEKMGHVDDASNPVENGIVESQTCDQIGKTVTPGKRICSLSTPELSDLLLLARGLISGGPP